MPNSPQTILITRNENEVGTGLKNWCKENGKTLLFSSFITTKTISNQEIPLTDWIFFSSPRSVKAYLDAYTINASKIGAHSTGTSNALKKIGLKVDFIGNKNDTPVEISHHFKQTIDPNDTVLFPVSQRSNKSIASLLAPKNVVIRTVYETLLVPKKLDRKPDTLVITSPSNYDGFLQENKLSVDQIIVVLGETTYNHIRLNSSEIDILKTTSPDEKAILNLLKSI